MPNPPSIKEKLYQACRQNTEERIHTIQDMLASVEEARNNETKSSAGDKYETGRAMLQIEADQSQRQLGEALQSRQALSQIDPKKPSTRVEPGSLVETNRGSYYLAIGIGKISVAGEDYFCVSSQAPIARAMLGKQGGETAVFNGTAIRILAVR